MADKILPGYPGQVGYKLLAVDHYGPASYNGVSETIGNLNVLTGIAYLGLAEIDAVQAADYSVSGTYQVFLQPVGTGPRKQYNIYWNTAGSQAGVNSVTISSAGSGQNNGTFNINGTGGGGTGAIAQIVIAGGAITSAKVLNPGRNYTSAPTFTVAQGGTPGTLTATVGVVQPTPVLSGTNLTGETIRLLVIGK